MKTISFNRNWTFYDGEINPWLDDKPRCETVTLPHDAMILQRRDPSCSNQGHTGFYPGSIATYIKEFTFPQEYTGKRAVLHFDGVFSSCYVYVNDYLVSHHHYGYSAFECRIDPYIVADQNNTIKVIADTSYEEESRWYTGTGICRDVTLFLYDEIDINKYDLKIATESYDPIILKIDIKLSGKTESLPLTISIFDREEFLMQETFKSENDSLSVLLRCSGLRFWSADDPYLYVMKICDKDRILREEKFGIRKLEKSEKGLLVNGKPVKLAGACVHHDHGVIGAVSLKDAEERKVRLLKSEGFNAVRCAHGHASERFLEACDSLGMYVMDEAFDMWTVSKRRHDYSNYFLDKWEEDLTVLASKDYNHPSVILYSIGNEIDELGTKAGIYWNKKMVDKLHELDQTRFVTNGVNGLSTVMDRLEEIMPEIEKQLKEKSGDKEGSNVLNDAVSLAGGESGDILFASELIREKITPALNDLDIAGMNYMPIRYELDHDKHPDWLFLGTETYPADIARLWDLVQKHDYVIGDMTWTGIDYLGEAGCAVFRYKKGETTFGSPYPARSAYMGDIDLIGTRRSPSFLKEIVYGLRKDPYIAIEHPKNYGQTVIKNPWMLYDDSDSWNFSGYENQKTKVRVYCSASEVELFINGVSKGRKKCGKSVNYISEYDVVYEPGEICAVAYEADTETGRNRIVTADDRIGLSLTLDKAKISADGLSLAYLLIELKDEKGRINQDVIRNIRIELSGPGRLAGLGSGDPESENDYFADNCNTYRGRALAVIRSINEKGKILIKVSCDTDQKEIEIEVI